MKALLCVSVSFPAILIGMSAPALAQQADSPPAPTVRQAPAAPAAADASAPTDATADAGASAQGGWGEIMVTAQRRSERLQDVPISVAALSDDTLEANHIRGVQDLRAVVPSLNVVNTNGFLSTSLRGIGSTAVAPGYENPIAIYVDGVYLASQQGTFLNLANVAQVEVLKGPQGTLFGRNATAGLLQISTLTPTQSFKAIANLSYGNYDTIEGTAYVAGGVAPDLAADISFYGLHQGDGFGKNLTTGKDVYQTKKDILVRSKWVWTPGSTTEVTLIGDYGEQDNTNVIQASLPGRINGYVPALGPQPDRGYNSIADSPNLKRGWNAGGSLKIDQDIGALNLVSTTAYRKSRFTQFFDYDFTELHLADISFRIPERQFSQEIQLQPAAPGRFKWVVGAYYFNYKGGYEPFHLNLYYANTLLTFEGTQRAESLAGYAQGTYEIADRTNVTLGVRYTTEKRELTGTTTVALVAPPVVFPTTVAPQVSKRFDKVTFRASLDHRFSEEVLGYVSFNRGFKSGGFNTGSPGSAPYAPETIDAYEAGLKTNVLGGALRLNLAGFYYDYSNVQSQRLAGGVIQIVNAAAARAYGMDADFDARLSDRLRVNGGIGWVNAKYTSYPNGLLSNPAGGPSMSPADLSGRYLPLSAKYTFNLGINYESPLAGGVLTIAPNLYHNSGYYNEADNVIHQKAFTQLGGTIRWASEGERFTVGVFGRNLTNKRILAYASTQAGNGTVSSVFSPPRTYGVTLGFKY